MSRKRTNVQFHVRPRYTGGSPAMVDELTARKVGQQEWEGYNCSLEGAYGPDEQARAKVLGLSGVAYSMAETGSGKKFRWVVVDLITGETTSQHHENEIVAQGYIRFCFLTPAARASLNKTGREVDYDRTWWKQDMRDLSWSPYKADKAREP